MYHPLITEYFEKQSSFAMAHEIASSDSVWHIHGLDFGYGVAEIETNYVEGDIGIRQAIALDKLLDVLQKQE